MPIKKLAPKETLDASRGDVVVAIPVFGGYELLAQCLKSVLECTAVDVPIVIADDASRDPAIETFVEKLGKEESERTLFYLRQDQNLGFVENMNSVFALTDPADVVILNSDCVVSEGWLEGLRDAAYSDSLVATASSLTNHGTILSVPHRNTPVGKLPADWPLSRAADDVRRNSQRLYPRIPTAVGHCTYVKRSALELVGNFDTTFSPGYGEEVDFSQRCVINGLCHVVADDVFVLHHGSGSFNEGGGLNRLQAKHNDVISDRYKYYDDWVESSATDRSSQLARALANAKRTFLPLSVTIDGRVLGPHQTGTQIYLLEIIGALRRTQKVVLRVVVPRNLGGYARDFFLHHDIGFIYEEDAVEKAQAGDRTDLVHRPFQVTSYDDLELLSQLGERIVISHLDLIAFHNPSYFSSFDEWEDQRDLTQLALGFSDRVVFISRHAADDAIKNGLIERDRASIALLGSDHALVKITADAKRPDKLPRSWSDEFLVCLGTDFRHKNREFAIKLLKRLREDHGWNGSLIFAGPHVDRGSSAGEEAECLLFDRELSEHVVDLAAVDDSEKAWLLENASAVVYPSVHEGFGFLPFEAAEAGVPCIFAWQSSLKELLPSYLALIEPWNAAQTAKNSIGVLRPGPEREDHVAALRAASAKYTWSKSARSLLAIYEEALASPVRIPKQLREQLDDYISVSSELVESQRDWEGEREDLTGYIRQLEWRAEAYERLSSVDKGLVGEDGIPLAIRRPLLAISHRTVLRKIFFSPMKLAYGAARKLRGGKSQNGSLETAKKPELLEKSNDDFNQDRD